MPGSTEPSPLHPFSPNPAEASRYQPKAPRPVTHLKVGMKLTQQEPGTAPAKRSPSDLPAPLGRCLRGQGAALNPKIPHFPGLLILSLCIRDWQSQEATSGILQRALPLGVPDGSVSHGALRARVAGQPGAGLLSGLALMPCRVALALGCSEWRVIRSPSPCWVAKSVNVMGTGSAPWTTGTFIRPPVPAVLCPAEGWAQAFLWSQALCPLPFPAALT